MVRYDTNAQEIKPKAKIAPTPKELGIKTAVIIVLLSFY